MNHVDIVACTKRLCFNMNLSPPIFGQIGQIVRRNYQTQTQLNRKRNSNGIGEICKIVF